MRLSGFKLPLERLSATSLSTFNVCPEQFRQKYILNEKEAMSGERFMGSVTHQALALLFDEDQLQNESMETDPTLAVAQAWQNVIEREGEPEWHDKDATESFRRAKQMITTYWPTATKVEVVKSEARFEETIAGVKVVGYIDRELKDRILEVKTASQKVSKPKPRWSFQGRLYSLVSALPVEWHVVTRQATPKVYTAAECPELLNPGFNPDATVRFIQHSVERMNDLYARHGANEPWPMEGIYGDWTCGYCSFKRRCFAWTSPASSTSHFGTA